MTSLSRLRRMLLVSLLGLAAADPAFALRPTQSIDRYVHQAWTTDQGLPQNAVYATVVSRQGYLWIGTDEGLVRFDGLRFKTFDRTNTPALRDTFVFALHEARDGALWIGTDRGGLLRHQHGQFTAYGPEQGLPPGRVQSIADGPDGSIWVGLRGGGLAHVTRRGIRVVTTRQGLGSDNVQSLLTDRAGRLWVGTELGLDRLDGSRVTHFDRSHGLPAGGVRALYEDRRGRLWVGTVDGLLGARVTGGGLAVLRGNRFEDVSADWTLPSSAVMHIHEDAHGTLWLGTAGGGLVRLAGQHVAHWLLEETPVDDLVYAVAEDSEGNLWLGTAPGGLHRLRDGIVTTLTAADGLPDEVIESLYEDPDGRTWVGTHAAGLCRVDGPRLACRSTAQGLSHARVNAMLDDGDGGLWIGTEAGLDRLRGDEVSHVTTAGGLPVDHVNALMRDREGRLWVGTWGGGVVRENRSRSGYFTSLPGLDGPYVTSLLQDAAGQVWIGTTDALFVWRNGVLTNLTLMRDLPGGIEALHADADGTLWIGTRRDGLLRYRDGEVARYTTREGLFDNLVGTILDDGAGHLWFTCNRGIFRVARAQLEEVAAGRRATVETRAFDTTDGMRSRECNFGQGRWRLRDGRLWFASVGGIVVVDPQRIPRNPVPPHVHLEEVVVDGEALPVDRAATLDSSRRRFEFAFVGVSLGAPARVRYRFQLDGFDPAWIDAADARTVHYTNLPPGTYRFRVTAANGDGVWNEAGTSFAFAVRRPVWQRPLFLAGVGGLVAVAIGGLGYRRVRSLRRDQQQQSAFARELIAFQEGERQRLASDLHDGLGQHLLVIRNWASLSLQVLGTPEKARPLLQEIVDTTSLSLRDIRAMTHALQPYDLAHVGLRAVLDAMLTRVAESSGLTIAAELEDVDLPIDAQIHLFRVVQETITNIVKHAEATQARVVVRNGPGAVEVIVQDNGRGFPRGDDPVNAPIGFGLRSLAERMRLLGGFHLIESGAQGTTVHAVVPRPEEPATRGH